MLLQVVHHDLAVLGNGGRADRAFARNLIRCEALACLEPLPGGVDQRDIGCAAAEYPARRPDQSVEFGFWYGIENSKRREGALAKHFLLGSTFWHCNSFPAGKE